MEITSVKRIHQSDWTDSGVRFLRARDIVSASKGEEPADYLYISQEKYDEYSRLSGKVKIGDLLVTGVGSIGVPMLVNTEEPLYFKDGNIIWFRNESVHGEFFYYSFTAKNIQKFIKDVAGIGTVGTYTIDSGKKTPIYLPSWDEQVKVGQFFTAISDLITLHQREYDKTLNIKKAMLEKMFPKDGADKPEIRFAGCTDAWEQRKLGDIATFINGRAYSQDELLDEGKYKVLRVGNFYTNDSWYYSDMELGEKYYANAGDLLYTWSATFGPHIWFGDKVIYHYHIWKVELSELLDKQFTVQILDYDKAKITSDHNGSTMIHITKSGMENKSVSVPSLTEQKKIGEFLSSFDHLITLHQRELEKLQNMKKALLDKMFVQESERDSK
jgi:type I restriction enzyme S subunit